VSLYKIKLITQDVKIVVLEVQIDVEVLCTVKNGVRHPVGGNDSTELGDQVTGTFNISYGDHT
jgi:hypothetical protein